MNVRTLLPFPPTPMYYSHFLSGVEWSQRTIGGDEMLVVGARYDTRLRVKDSQQWSAHTYNW
jgi:hypothetical protein